MRTMSRSDSKSKASRPSLGNARSTTVLLAEDDPLTREALATVIDGAEDFTIVGLAGDADQAIEVAVATQPQLALLDVRMPGGGGARAAREITRALPGVSIVAISAHDDRETIGEMVAAGARGYVTKDTPPDQILDTLRRCVAGELIFTPSSASELMREYVRSSRMIEEAKAKRRRREERLHQICELGQMRCEFQPIVRLASGEVEMYEALTRFECPGEMSTLEWFEEAAELNMSVELELAAVAKAIDTVRRSGSEDIDIVVGLNVSPATLLDSRLAPTIEPLAGRRVVIEMTEHARVLDYALTKRALAKLRERGVRLAIDDAGAGFASLRHILDLMPDLIKLDISLVRNIDTDAPRRALATGLITFAREIGAEIVAEGIETEAELDALTALGVGLGQGYYLARPAPLDQVLAERIAL